MAIDKLNFLLKKKKNLQKVSLRDILNSSVTTIYGKEFSRIVC